MTKISSNHAIFNGVFFSFSFKLLGKKISIYIAILIYCLIIAAYTIIVPLIANKAPIELFTLSTSSMFLMFAMSIVACYIAVEIFRTGIDDGTELLSVSKPISRKEIITVKLIIFLIYMLIVSLISLIIAAFTFLNKLSTDNDSLNIMVGIFVGTLVSGIIFGSIATILSIYIKKISAMLITVAISFILMVISMLMSFVVTTPVQYINDSGKTISSINAVNYSKDKKDVDFEQGVTVYDSGTQENPEEVWKEAVEHSGYNYDVQFDFGYQISSIYTLGSVNSDFQKTLRTLSVINQPINLTFDKYNISDSSDSSDNPSYLSGVNIKYYGTTTDSPTTPTSISLLNLYLNSFGGSSLTNISSDNQNSINGKVSYSDDDITAINQNVVNKGISENTDSSVSVEDWDSAWTNYQPSSSSTSSSTDSQSSPASAFAENFFNKNLSAGNDSQTVINQFNEIQYAAYLSLLYNGVQVTYNTGDTSNANGYYSISDENRVQLSLLGVNVPSEISADAASLALTPQEQLMQALSSVQFQNSIIFNYTSSSGSSTKLILSNPFSLVTSDTMSNARIVHVKPVLENQIIIPVWVVVAIIIFAIAIILYFERDFA